MTRIQRLFKSGLVAMIGLLGVARAASPEGGDVVLMSPYEVTAATAEFKGWTKLRSPNFVVYSDASLKKAREMVRQMEKLHLVSQVMFGRRQLAHEPTVVVLPTQHSDWRKLRSKGSVEWTVAVSRNGPFARSSVVEYDWDREGADVLWTSLASGEQEMMGLDLPFVMAKGLAFFYETLRVSREGMRIGSANPRIMALRDRNWMDWPRFFDLTFESPEYTRGGMALHRMSAQAALFMHYWMTRVEPGSFEKLLQWGALLQAGRPASEARFQSVFGMTYSECERALGGFLDGEQFQVKIFNFPPETLDFVVTEIDVHATEMRELFVLIQILNQRVPASEESLTVLLDKGVVTPELRPMLAQACLDWGRNDDALGVVRRLIDDGLGSAEAYEAAAQLTLEQAMRRRQDGGAADSYLSAEEQAQILLWAEAALRREPLLVQANETYCLARASGPEITADALEAIKARCLALEGSGPTDRCLMIFATAAHRAGADERSRRACEALLRSDYSRDAVRAVARALLAEMGLPIPEPPPEPRLVTADPVQ